MPVHLNTPLTQSLWLHLWVCCCRNTEVLQEQLHAANSRADIAEQRAAESDGLAVQVAELLSHRQTWDKVLQVPHIQLYRIYSCMVVAVNCVCKSTQCLRHNLIGFTSKLAMIMQGLPDAQNPENVLTLLDNLQTQLLKSAERLGQVENQCAEQTGECSAKAQSPRSAADQCCDWEHSNKPKHTLIQRRNVYRAT